MNISQTRMTHLKQLEAESIHIIREVANCVIETSAPVVIDQYKQVAGTGSFIIIDRLTNVTVGAGMIINTVICATNSKQETRIYTGAEIALNKYICDYYPEWNCLKL